VTKDPTSTWENEGDCRTRLILHSQLSGRSLRSDQRHGRHNAPAVYYDSHDGNVYDTVNKFDYGAANDHGCARHARCCGRNESNKIHLWLSADGLQYEFAEPHVRAA